MALVTFSLNKIVGSLFHSLVTDGINFATQDTSTGTVTLYIRGDSINNLNFLIYHFLTNESGRKNLLLRESLPLTISLLKLQIKKPKNMLIKEAKVFP